MSQFNKSKVRPNTEVKVIPFLVQWIFSRGLPPGWGKNMPDKK